MGEFSLPVVAAGTLVGLLVSRLFFLRALSSARSGTRSRVLRVGSALVLIALVAWLGVSDAGDELVHAMARAVPDAVARVVIVTFLVVILDAVVTAITNVLSARGGRPGGASPTQRE